MGTSASTKKNSKAPQKQNNKLTSRTRKHENKSFFYFIFSNNMISHLCSFARDLTRKSLCRYHLCSSLPGWVQSLKVMSVSCVGGYILASRAVTTQLCSGHYSANISFCISSFKIMNISTKLWGRHWLTRKLSIFAMLLILIVIICNAVAVLYCQQRTERTNEYLEVRTFNI